VAGANPCSLKPVASNNSNLTSRSVRSFVIRNGRMTEGQKAALDTFMPIYGVPFSDTPLDFNDLFKNDAPVWLEIGFGNGEALIDIATKNPEINFLGIERVLLFFPDPWHKKRHHKRRILQSETVTLIKKALAEKGVIHCATDWADYADSMLEVLRSDSELTNLNEIGGFSDKPDYRPLTKFEQRGLRLGHDVFDLLFAKTR